MPWDEKEPGMNLALLGFGGLELHDLELAKGAANGLQILCRVLVVTIDALQFDRQVAEKIKSFVELVSDLQGHVDGFFHGCFGSVGKWRF